MNDPQTTFSEQIKPLPEYEDVATEMGLNHRKTWRNSTFLFRFLIPLLRGFVAWAETNLLQQRAEIADLQQRITLVESSASAKQQQVKEPAKKAAQ